jgi:hypothetical protein
MSTAPNGAVSGTGVNPAGDAGSDAAAELKGTRHGAPSAPLRTTNAAGLRRVLVGLRVHGVDWLIEVVAINATILAVAFVRYRGQIPLRYRLHTGVTALAMITVAYTVFLFLFRTYRIVWRFASVRDMAILALSLLCTSVTVGLIEVGLMAGSRPIPLSVLALGGPGAYLILAHLKLVPRTRQAVGGNRGRKPLIIFGAGSAGIALVRQLAYERNGYRPVAFLDDDLRKVGRDIAGLPVAGTRLDLARAVKQYGADAVVIAIPSAQSPTIREITHRALDVNARALAVPSITELIAGTELSLRDVGIEDLVGRSEVTVNDHEIRAAFTGCRVLITGAAGSIGSELARQVLHLGPSHIDLIDNNESGLADLRDQLIARRPRRHYRRQRHRCLGDQCRVRGHAPRRGHSCRRVEARRHRREPATRSSGCQRSRHMDLRKGRRAGSGETIHLHLHRQGGRPRWRPGDDKAHRRVDDGVTVGVGHNLRRGAIRECSGQPGERPAEVRAPDQPGRPNYGHSSRRPPLLHVHE